MMAATPVLHQADQDPQADRRTTLCKASGGKFATGSLLVTCKNCVRLMGVNHPRNKVAK